MSPGTIVLILFGAWVLLAAWYWALCVIGKRTDQEHERLIRQFRATDHQRNKRGLRVVHWTTED